MWGCGVYTGRPYPVTAARRAADARRTQAATTQTLESRRGGWADLVPALPMTRPTAVSAGGRAIRCSRAVRRSGSAHMSLQIYVYDAADVDEPLLVTEVMELEEAVALCHE